MHRTTCIDTGGAPDRRGLNPLFWQHVRPYGEVRLDMTSSLALGLAAAPGGQ
jgi:hypothetical protein